MHSTYLLPMIATAAAIASTAALAWPTQVRHVQSVTRAEHVSPSLQLVQLVQLVPNTGVQGATLHRWQYFPAPRALRAVMISPLSKDFLSVDDGPKHLPGPTGAMSTAQLAQS